MIASPLYESPSLTVIYNRLKPLLVDPYLPEKFVKCTGLPCGNKSKLPNTIFLNFLNFYIFFYTVFETDILTDLYDMRKYFFISFFVDILAYKITHSLTLYSLSLSPSLSISLSLSLTHPFIQNSENKF